MPETITSHQNARVKQVRRLREKSAREDEQRFLIDSLRDLERALLCSYEVDYVLVAPSLLRDNLRNK